MEQKAVTYKTVKGMARDMAMSSGNNDFSYENYNIRITTRGKEDSLVVTNEKGTESNIIATRDVLKTVNNVFVGMQPDFYNSTYEAVVYTKDGVLHDDTDLYDYTELYTPVTEQNPPSNDGYRQITKAEFDDKHKVEYNQDYSINSNEAFKANKKYLYVIKYVFNKVNDVTSENFSEKKSSLYIKVDDNYSLVPSEGDGSTYDSETSYYYRTITYVKVKDTDIYVSGTAYFRQSVNLDSAITFYKKNVINTITPLTGENGVIKFALNTEYPTDSELVAKSVFKINEQPITYNDEQYTLLNDGSYIDDNHLITINENHNYGYDTESIKDIVLNGDTVSNGAIDEFYNHPVATVTSETFDNLKSQLYTRSGDGTAQSPYVYTKLASDATYSDSTTYYYQIDVRIENINAKPWLDSYKTLYEKITDNNFEFSGFNANINDISFANSSSLTYIPVTQTSKSVVLPNGAFKEGENYESGTISAPQTITGDYQKVQAEVPQLGYLTSVIFSKNYPTSTKLNIQKLSYKLRIPIFKKITDETYVEGTKYYNIEGDSGVKYCYNYTEVTVTRETFDSLKSKLYYLNRYIQATFNFDVKEFIGNKINKKASEVTLSDGSTLTNPVVELRYSFYSTNNPNSACFNYGIVSGVSSSITDDEKYLAAIGPFFAENVFTKTYNNQDTTVPDIFNSNSITFLEDAGTASDISIDTTDYIKCVSTTNLPSGYYFPDIYEIANDVDLVNFDSKKSDLWYIDEGVYTQVSSSATYDDEETYYYYRGKDTSVVKDGSNNIYNINSYSLITSANNYAANISAIKTFKDTKNVYYTEFSIGNYRYVYDKLNNTICTYTSLGTITQEAYNNATRPLFTKSGSYDYVLATQYNSETIYYTLEDYYIYKLKIDNHPVDYIVYTKNDLDNIESATNVYKFSDSGFTQINSNGSTMLPSDLKNPKVQLIIGSGQIVKNGDGYKFDDTTSGGTTIHGSVIKSFERLNYLPIYTIDGTSNTTTIDSIVKEVFINPPTYNEVIAKYGFVTNNFKASLDVQSFRLKRSNNNWDDKFIYNFLSQASEFVDYTRKIIPMSVLDTYNISALKAKYDANYVEFSVSVTNPESDYFGSNRFSSLTVTIIDLQNKTYSKTCTLSDLIIGYKDTTLLNQDSEKHTFVIKDIRETDLPSEINLEVENIKDNIGFEDKYNGNEVVTLQILKDNTPSSTKKYAREIIDYGNYKFTSTIEFDFGDSYKNKFYSIISNDLLVANFGDYHALTIPGRILGSCTIDDYVVLFFHYSSPALNYYRYDSTNDIYRICPPNSIDLTNPDYYNLYTRNTKMGFDLAVEKGALLRDDNNDYINGKNEDYIVKLKYIDARPDNEENEWSEIVAKIANVSTQSSLFTEILEKKPYYSADILYHGNLGFNANNGIETIGYYESKDVIKVYFTDGKNQPRMIDIMTPLAQRNGTHRRWDAKSFDFIQEISGKEKYEITKQFGGGAFPSGSVQYFFTYTNLGGCETNPFLCSQLYYSAQSDSGNSPTKITDNTFKIKLTNLSKRFDYVNIYSVVRSSKDLQPLCKKIINISLNGKTEIEFTDNNLLGEVVDSTYLLMLQGTPISALTMAEKDNTLFLGNINKLQKALSVEDKDKLKNCFEVDESLREYQNYNPNEENWYENKFKDKVKIDYYGNEVKDANGDNVIDSKISLEGNSSDIKTFMYNEYYRLGIQLQDKFGKWSDPIFVADVKCKEPIKTTLTEKTDNEDNTIFIDNLKSEIPYFYLKVKDADELKNIVSDYGFVRIRPVIVYPNISSRNVLCQGLINPTMFNYSDRSMNAPYNFASYFFRPMPPAISNNKDEIGNSLHNVDITIPKVCGYPIEYRHGFPISGYHDAIEEGLAESEDTSNVDDNTIKALVDNYLSKQNLTSVKLTSNTIGWWINTSVYLREGELIINNMNSVTYKAGSKIYEVKPKGNKGEIDLLKAITSDLTDGNYGNGSVVGESTSANKFIGQMIAVGSTRNTHDSYEPCYGFRSHMHYFKNALIYFLSISWEDIGNTLSNKALNGNELVKSISDTHCFLTSSGLLFNEGCVWYLATYPVTLKFTPKSEIKLRKHRMLKRKTYFCDIVVKSNTITVASKNGCDGYIDDTGTDSSINNKAYFATTDGEIQCANGNKAYNFFADKLKEKLDNTYGSSEINATSRQQSLFYIDESICTLNSPEIEYDPTVQKIDLSTYKLNIIGAANITGYAQKVNIDAETPPATAGTTVCEGFKHDNIEVQNFNKEAYRYMLSGGYWYDNVFSEGDDENPEKKYDSADLISDQYCWWVYPFNRAILNNSKEGANGKCRTKQWYNYHYSAFNDYFGSNSINYELKDAQQLYGDFQSVNFDNDWTTRKCLYFGSVDTAYTNPVPLCGVLGGSNEPEENAYEQTLAISSHTKFKDKDSYSAANYADIVPFAFRSTNHFLLSFKGNSSKNRLLPEYFSDTNLLESNSSEAVKTKTLEYYKLTRCDDVDLSSYSYIIKEINTSGSKIDVYKIGESGIEESPVGTLRINGVVGRTKNLNLRITDGSTIIEKYNVLFNKLEDKLKYTKEYFNNQVAIDNQIEFLDENFYGVKNYTDQINQIIQNSQVTACERPYVNYTNENAGIYKYGHIYIAQLERGVKSADEVFSGTEESVLLQNTWIPAGVAVNVDDVIGGTEIQYTEGDTFYQRYDCLKTYAYSDMAVNQVIESLSTMIQTRINLDGIYSLRGNIDNLGTNETNTNLLNTAYSQSDNYFTYSITDPYISQITEYCNMFTWSLTKQPMSRNDNWLAINLIAYYNATGSFGKITRIINYRNNLFCFQDNAISQIAYNERVQLTPSDGVPIEIGNSGKVQGLNYISSNVGCQNRWSVCPSKGYLYWVDDRRAEIYRFGEGLEPFSTINGFSDWVKANTYGEDWKPILSTNVPITTYYDNNNDDIYFVTEKDCLAYNEKLNAFESFFSYEDSFILNSAGNTIVIKEQDALVKDMTDYTDLYNENDTSWWSNGIRGDGLSSIELMHEGEYNKFFGDYKPYYLRFKVYPTDLQRDKIYTNLEFNLDAFNEKDIYMPDDTFTRVRVWNEYQWGEFNFDNIYGTTSYKKRFRTFYVQLPRASYYPTGLYEDYEYLYQRQSQWKPIDSSVLANTGLAYYSYWNENSACVNDRIRNPWVWMELYKNPKDKSNFVEFSFYEGEDIPTKKHYDLTDYKVTFADTTKGIAEFNKAKINLYILDDEVYVRLDENATRQDITYYNLESAYMDIRTKLYYQNYVDIDFDDYGYYEVLYKLVNDVYEVAQPSDRTNKDLKLYRLDYVNCANILTFDVNKTYYELIADNNRMEIHDIILKYFEA